MRVKNISALVQNSSNEKYRHILTVVPLPGPMEDQTVRSDHYFDSRGRWISTYSQVQTFGNEIPCVSTNTAKTAMFSRFIDKSLDLIFGRNVSRNNDLILQFGTL